MYDVSHFKANDDAEVLQYMRDHPFVILSGVTRQGEPIATHIPVLVDEQEGKIILSGHMMKKQSHMRAFSENPNALVIFHGAHSYVSASWYENKQVASTWNYMAVHASGKLQFVDESTLLVILKNLTLLFEGNPNSPALVENMPEDYLQEMTKAIIGFTIEVEKVQHVFKLSQNRDPKSFENIIQHLSKGSPESQDIAKAMEGRAPK